MRKIAFATLGCKVNWTDTEGILHAARHMGYEIVQLDEYADIYIVNTCIVTASAEQQSRQMLRRPKRINPNATVIAMGCFPEVWRNRVSSIPDVDEIFGISDRDEIISWLSKFISNDKEVNDQNIFEEAQSRSRAFLKIQEGCDRRCTYCIIPYARGSSRSIPSDEILKSCVELSRYHAEIVITGTDIGQYKFDDSKFGLQKLLNKILEKNGISRVRLSSLTPTIIDEDMVSIIASSNGKICRHVHMSIQSCSDDVLKNMGRYYASKDVIDAVDILTSSISDLAITADIIVGFPDESNSDFEMTRDILNKLPIAGLHVFPFSPRTGTEASNMTNIVSVNEMKKRALSLRKLARKKRVEFLNRLVGKRFDVIVTSKRSKDGMVSAFTDNGVSVSFPEGNVNYGEIGSGIISNVNELEVVGVWD